jgi:hypothetical protein
MPFIGLAELSGCPKLGHSLREGIANLRIEFSGDEYPRCV